LTTSLRKWQIAEFIENDEVEACEIVRRPALLGTACLRFQAVDQVNDIVEAPRLDVVLDLGFTRAADRTAAAEVSRAEGLEVKLHWLDVPAAERWARVEARNKNRGSTYSFAITRQMFDFMEARVEEPDEVEMLSVNKLSIQAYEAH
jgi:hypothetical protein